MNLPLRKVWRRYHGTVWKRTVKTRWWTCTLIVVYAAWAVLEVVLRPGGWVIAMSWQTPLVLIMAASFFTDLGRNYQQLDHYIGHQMAWQQAQQELHQRLLAEGVPQDEADQVIWQMDLDMHMQQHPEGDK